MLCEKVYSDILPHFAYCLTKNLPLSSSQTHLHSKWFPILQQGHLFAHVPLHKEPKLLSCVDFGRLFMRQVAALLSFWQNGSASDHFRGGNCGRRSESSKQACIA